ncbi:MAG: Holliday junction branch migration protein RuvA [Phocaeicola sp.]|uniref:Holliday junction branch migration protein RuvA n=1 Tax=Phocaeicola TaxID=909656 RepID=UPI00234ED248|nr:Holliday junction branch migration protein RuvA [Phocaeicola oris]MCE2616005.1 Holliday junction branch migration protein RuvA [Phocaeicola oris]
MIEYIKGKLVEATPTMAVIDCNGVGYGINISLNSYTSIANQKEVKLYVYEAIREDAYVLYGFTSKLERDLFLQLISVPGIGGASARMILSAYSPQELCTIISEENIKLLKTIKGIGLKTAQRIVVDLKDKVATLDIEAISGEHTPISAAVSEVHDEAVVALTMLGFAPAPSTKVVNAILKENASLPVEKVIKLALKRL